MSSAIMHREGNSVFQGGLVIPRDRLPELMDLVATGQLSRVDDIGWLPGYGQGGER